MRMLGNYLRTAVRILRRHRLMRISLKCFLSPSTRAIRGPP